MRKIGILCPSDTELAPFLSHIKEVKITEKAMLKVYEGMIGQMRVAALYSGVCKVNAAIAAQILIDTFQAEAIINAGVAGGMEESVELFDTIIAARSVYHDVARDILTEFHPWMESVYFKADKELLAAAKEYAKESVLPIRFGTIATGEKFIEDAGRAEINQAFAPLAVDMETAGAAHVCYVNGTPFLAVRTITDTAAHIGAEHFEQNCEKASAIAAEVVMGILAKRNI